MTKRLDPNLELRIVRMIQEGYLQREVSEILNVPIPTIAVVRKRNNLPYSPRNRRTQEEKAREREALAAMFVPPSPAMVRLAEFDPAIRRALNVRLGHQPPEETEDEN
jgi:transposase